MNPSASLLAALSSPTGLMLAWVAAAALVAAAVVMLLGALEVFDEGSGVYRVARAVLCTAGGVLLIVAASQYFHHRDHVQQEVLAAVQDAGMTPIGSTSEETAVGGHTLWNVPVRDADKTLHLFVVDRDRDGKVTLTVANYQRP